MKNTQTTPTINQSFTLSPEECAACAICLTADAIEIGSLARDIADAMEEVPEEQRSEALLADSNRAVDHLEALTKENVRLWDLLEVEIVKQPVDVMYDTFAVETLVMAKNSGPVAQNLLDTFLSYQTRKVGGLIEYEETDHRLD